MGRNLKTISSSTGKISKEKKEERKAIEIKASDGFTELQKTAPRHLNKVARAEYERIIKDIKNLPVRNLDRALLDSYCTWYAIYKETSKKLDEVGYFVNDPNKGLIANPLILTLEKATNGIQKAASQLGLTVDSRMKMFIPKQEEKPESIFDKFGG